MSARFLALGDSYTVGEGVRSADIWPIGLAQRLRQEGFAIDDPCIVAMTGWTTDELAAGVDAAALTPPYALVTLLIGVNDQYRGRTVDSYRKQFRILLGRAIVLAGGNRRRVLVISIPDWSVTRFARDQGRDTRCNAADIDTFNAAAREEAGRAGATWVDVTGISRQCGDAADWLAADSLHPSAAQYLLWLPPLLHAARAILAGSRDGPGSGCT